MKYTSQITMALICFALIWATAYADELSEENQEGRQEAQHEENDVEESNQAWTMPDEKMVERIQSKLESVVMEKLTEEELDALDNVFQRGSDPELCSHRKKRSSYADDDITSDELSEEKQEGSPAEEQEENDDGEINQPWTMPDEKMVERIQSKLESVVMEKLTEKELDTLDNVIQRGSDTDLCSHRKKRSCFGCYKYCGGRSCRCWGCNCSCKCRWWPFRPECKRTYDWWSRR